MKELKYIIANNIKKYRKKNQITQMDLAEKADLSLDTIKSIEARKRGMILDSFLKLTERVFIHNYNHQKLHLTLGYKTLAKECIY